MSKFKKIPDSESSQSDSSVLKSGQKSGTKERSDNYWRPADCPVMSAEGEVQTGLKLFQFQDAGGVGRGWRFWSILWDIFQKKGVVV